jgi:hypothetical protein
MVRVGAKEKNKDIYRGALKKGGLINSFPSSPPPHPHLHPVRVALFVHPPHQRVTYSAARAQVAVGRDLIGEGSQADTRVYTVETTIYGRVDAVDRLIQTIAQLIESIVDITFDTGIDTKVHTTVDTVDS